MRYVIEIEAAEELNCFGELTEFVEWFLRNVAKTGVKSIDVRCGE